MNPYFTVNDSEHFTFYRIPKLLFTDEIYQTVSTDAKMLYGLLLDRLSLSEKNDWKDEHGRVYQYFTIHQAQELLHFGHEKVCRLFAELDAADLTLNPSRIRPASITRKKTGSSSRMFTSRLSTGTPLSRYKRRSSSGQSAVRRNRRMAKRASFLICCTAPTAVTSCGIMSTPSIRIYAFSPVPIM